MSRRDQLLLIALKFVRMVAYGQTTMILVPFFLNIGSSEEEIGIFMTLTLLGDVVLSTFVTAIADRVGRRAMLAISSVAMILSGLIFAYFRNFWILLAAAIVGVISPSGDEVGPFRAIEESTLAHLTPYGDRAMMFAWQNLVGTAGLALGSFSGGWLEQRWLDGHKSPIRAYESIFYMYAGWAVIALAISVLLSHHSEENLGTEGENTPLLAEAQADTAAEIAAAEITERALEDGAAAEVRAEEDEDSLAGEAALQAAAKPSGKVLTFSLCLLFGIDSLAYGFMPTSWVVEYMETIFHVSPGVLGTFFLLSNMLSAVTSIPSAFLTYEIGPVLAIGVTKIAAGGLGAIVPLAHGGNQAMALLLFRSLFDTMDVVPRQVFITSVVPAAQRTKTLGLVNVIKTLARSIGPIFTGIIAGQNALWICFVIMGVLEWVFAALVMGFFL